jgi:hypothetical protein
MELNVEAMFRFNFFFSTTGDDSDNSEDMTVRREDRSSGSPAHLQPPPPLRPAPLSSSSPSPIFPGLFNPGQFANVSHQPFLTTFRVNPLYNNNNNVVNNVNNDFLSSGQILFPSENIYETAAKLLFMCVKWSKSVPSFLQVIQQFQI